MALLFVSEIFEKLVNFLKTKFYTFAGLNYAYFIVISLLSSVVFYLASNPFGSVSYKNSLFLVIAAFTNTGLSTIDLSDISSGQQAILGILMIIGSPIFISIVVLLVRERAFRSRVRQERSRLEELEARANRLLCFIAPAFWLSIHIIGIVILGVYMDVTKPVASLENGVRPGSLGVFLSISAFTNSGMSLLDANMIPFQTEPTPLAMMAFLILAGNTAYPLFLRLVVWTVFRLICLARPKEDDLRDLKTTFRFVLKYPRNVYTHLFPAVASRWHLGLICAMTGLDWIGFERIMKDSQVLSKIPKNFWLLNGFFQAIAVRTAGFYIIALSEMEISLQFLYCVMMYFAAYPVLLTIRHTNIYEAEALGVCTRTDETFSDSLATPGSANQQQTGSLPHQLSRGLLNVMTNIRQNIKPTDDGNRKNRSMFLDQIRRQLWHDLLFPCIAIFVIVALEAPKVKQSPLTHSMFNIIFEVMAAYTCVGLSIGLSDGRSYSFCGDWRTVPQMTICVLMIFGRLRILPVALDKAVTLPGRDDDEGEAAELLERETGSEPENAVDPETAVNPGTPLNAGAAVVPGTAGDLETAIDAEIVVEDEAAAGLPTTCRPRRASV